MTALEAITYGQTVAGYGLLLWMGKVAMHYFWSAKPTEDGSPAPLHPKPEDGPLADRLQRGRAAGYWPLYVAALLSCTTTIGQPTAFVFAKVRPHWWEQAILAASLLTITVLAILALRRTVRRLIALRERQRTDAG